MKQANLPEKYFLRGVVSLSMSPHLVFLHPDCLNVRKIPHDSNSFHSVSCLEFVLMSQCFYEEHI
jgi:hypothetical protein